MLELTYQDLILKICPYFTSTILKRGWQYYRDTIESFQIKNKSIVHAIVHGSEDYTVRLDVRLFSNSSCDCPYNGYCKHMAAVLFEAAARAGIQPRQLLTPTGKPVGSKPLNAASAAQNEINRGASEAAAAAPSAQTVDSAEPPGKAGNTAADRKPRITMPKSTGSASDWQSYFEKEYKRYPATDKYSLDAFFPNVVKRLYAYAQDWQPTLQRLYQLQVILFAIKRADELQREVTNYHSYYSYSFEAYFYAIAGKCVEAIKEIVGEIDVEEARSLYLKHLQDTAAYLAEHGFPEQGSVMRWNTVYGLLWWNLLRDDLRIREERKRLKAALTEGAVSLRKRDSLIMCQALLDVMEGKDERVMSETSRTLTDKNPAMFFSFLETFLGSGEWDRLILWLQWLRPMVKASNPTNMEPYFQYWQEAGKHREIEPKWKETICYLLPASFPYYAQFLMKHKRYREWIDLNIGYGRTPLEVNPADLKLVEAHDIHLVLPMYHFAVEGAILQKNRSSYKTAVQLLKKLGPMYKRLKKEERWNDYILQLTVQFSRYRAFQEELRKGRLIL